MDNTITTRNILALFFQMEEDEELFSLQTDDGIYYWDIVRAKVYLCLHTLFGGPFLESTPIESFAPMPRIKDLFKALLNRASWRYLHDRSAKYMFFTVQRGGQGADIMDKISDHLYDLLADDAVAVELANRAAISYRKLVFGGDTRVPPVAIPHLSSKSEIPKIANKISTVVKKHFGVSIDMHSPMAHAMATFCENEKFYSKLFAQYRPDAIVCSNNGELGGLFYAAKKMKIPILELQHGGSSRETIIWSYPQAILSDNPGLSLPTAYLTFSEFWHHNTHYPVSLMRAIGNDHFYQENVAGHGDGILVVSAYMYHDELVQLSLDLSGLVGGKKIYYKLHPHQFERKAETAETCRNAHNIVIISDEMGFSELFENCNYVVGIQSTALYIALQAGKTVCIYKRFNYFWHDDISAYVEYFDCEFELSDIILGSRRERIDEFKKVPTFFQKFNPSRFWRVLDEIGSYV